MNKISKVDRKLEPIESQLTSGDLKTMTQGYKSEPKKPKFMSQAKLDAMEGLKLYILGRYSFDKIGVGVDEVQSMVVRAHTPKQARAWATGASGIEGREVWLDAKETYCHRLTDTDGGGGVIIVDKWES